MSRGIEKFMLTTTIIFTDEMGRRLLYARRKMGLRQDELGKLLGVSQTIISRLETGKARIAPVNTGRYRAVLDRHFEFVLTGEGAGNYAGYQPLTIDRQIFDENEV